MVILCYYAISKAIYYAIRKVLCYKQGNPSYSSLKVNWNISKIMIKFKNFHFLGNIFSCHFYCESIIKIRVASLMLDNVFSFNLMILEYLNLLRLYYAHNFFESTKTTSIQLNQRSHNSHSFALSPLLDSLILRL